MGLLNFIVATSIGAWLAYGLNVPWYAMIVGQIAAFFIVPFMFGIVLGFKERRYRRVVIEKVLRGESID